MRVDNNQDGVEDIIFQFRFTTEIRQPSLFTALVGGIAGIPPITALDGAGSEGLSLRQNYTVTMVKDGKSTCLNNGMTLFAVPSNVGPRTMPDSSLCSTKQFTTWATTFASSRELWMILSTSTWARPSTPSTSAWESAACCRQRRMLMILTITLPML